MRNLGDLKGEHKIKERVLIILKYFFTISWIHFRFEKALFCTDPDSSSISSKKLESWTQMNYHLTAQISLWRVPAHGAVLKETKPITWSMGLRSPNYFTNAPGFWMQDLFLRHALSQQVRSGCMLATGSGQGTSLPQLSPAGTAMLLPHLMLGGIFQGFRRLVGCQWESRLPEIASSLLLRPNFSLSGKSDSSSRLRFVF